MPLGHWSVLSRVMLISTLSIVDLTSLHPSRFVRHSEELFQIIRFVYQTRNQLGIIYIFSNLVVVLVGAVMYYAEGRPHFESILASCWWSLVTLFAVGYGDKVPQTLQGCMVATVAVVIGMVIITLPITIVVGKFAEWHGIHKTRRKENRRGRKGSGGNNQRRESERSNHRKVSGDSNQRKMSQRSRGSRRRS